jgi:pentatricopeptide repeat protein
MDSLIEAAEKNFEAKTPLSSKTRLAMKVFKFYLFQKLAAFRSQDSPSQGVVDHLRSIVKQLKDNSDTNEDPIFANVLWAFYFENSLRPIEDVPLLIDLIDVSLSRKMNAEVKRIIEIGINTQIIKKEEFADEEERGKRSAFFDMCSYAFNLTRNMDKAIDLLRRVEQRSDMNFSISLFNNVIEWCMKCKQENTAESLMNEYAENVDKHIKKNYQILWTMITGYSKLWKVDKAFEIYCREFNDKIEVDKENLKFLNTPTLNALLECLVKKNYIRDAEDIFQYHLQASCVVDSTSASLMIKGFCKAKNIQKALELWKSLENYNIEADEQFYSHFLEGCAKNTDIKIAFVVLELMESKQITPSCAIYNYLIEAWVSIDQMEKAWQVIEHMKDHGVTPDRYSYWFLFKGIKSVKYKKHLYKAIDLVLSWDADNANFKLTQYLESHPEEFSKLKNELEEAGLSSESDFSSPTVIQKMSDSEHLTKIAKEIEEVNPSEDQNDEFEIEGVPDNKDQVSKNAKIEVIKFVSSTTDAKDFPSDTKTPNFCTKYCFNVLLNACINCNEMKMAQKLLERMNKISGEASPDEISYNTIIKGCAKSKNLETAFKMFNSMLKNDLRPNDVTYNSLIDAWVRCGKLEDAWDLFHQMEENGVPPDNFTYSTLIKGNQTYDLKNLDRAFRLLEQVKERREKPDEIVYNCLIDACIRHKDINRAVAVFNEMHMANIEPSSVTYGLLIKAYGQTNQLENAFNAFLRMKELGLHPNDVTYGCLLDACIRNHNLAKAEEVFSSMQKDDIHMNTIIYTTMIKGYSKAHKLTEALEIYEKMKSDSNNEPNSVTYNSLIDCCVRCDNMKKAYSLFTEMKERKVKPDLITFSTMIKGYCREHSIEKAFKVLKNMEIEKIKPDEVLFNSLLDGCWKANEIDLALTVYKSMKDQHIKPSNVTFSILVKIYGKSKQLSKALGILEEMKKLDITPGIVVYTWIIQTCIKAKQLNTALEKFEEMKKRKVEADGITYQTILKGCVQFGKFEQACKILEDAVSNQVPVSQETSEYLFSAMLSSDQSSEGRVNELREKLKRNKFHKGGYKNSTNRNR